MTRHASLTCLVISHLKFDSCHYSSSYTALRSDTFDKFDELNEPMITMSSMLLRAADKTDLTYQISHHEQEPRFIENGHDVTT